MVDKIVNPSLVRKACPDAAVGPGRFGVCLGDQCAQWTQWGCAKVVTAIALHNIEVKMTQLPEAKDGTQSSG